MNFIFNPLYLQFQVLPHLWCFRVIFWSIPYFYMIYVITAQWYNYCRFLPFSWHNKCIGLSSIRLHLYLYVYTYLNKYAQCHMLILVYIGISIIHNANSKMLVNNLLLNMLLRMQVMQIVLQANLRAVYVCWLNRINTQCCWWYIINIRSKNFDSHFCTHMCISFLSVCKSHECILSLLSIGYVMW